MSLRNETCAVNVVNSSDFVECYWKIVGIHYVLILDSHLSSIHV